MKVVINKCFGGFGLSPEAIREYAMRKFGKEMFFYEADYANGHTWDNPKYKRYEKAPENRCSYVYSVMEDHGDAPTNLEGAEWLHDDGIERNDPVLVAIVEELGGRADGSFARLSVVEIPDGIDWYISDYDGQECVEEKHRSWS